MAKHHLDWTYAFTNRLRGTSVETSSFSASRDELADSMGEVIGYMERNRIEFTVTGET